MRRTEASRSWPVERWILSDRMRGPLHGKEYLYYKCQFACNYYFTFNLVWDIYLDFVPAVPLRFLHNCHLATRACAAVFARSSACNYCCLLLNVRKAKTCTSSVLFALWYVLVAASCGTFKVLTTLFSKFSPFFTKITPCGIFPIICQSFSW